MEAAKRQSNGKTPFCNVFVLAAFARPFHEHKHITKRSFLLSRKGRQMDKIERIKEIAAMDGMTLATTFHDEFIALWDELVRQFSSEGMNFKDANEKVWKICEDAKTAKRKSAS